MKSPFWSNENTQPVERNLLAILAVFYGCADTPSPEYGELGSAQGCDATSLALATSGPHVCDCSKLERDIKLYVHFYDVVDESNKEGFKSTLSHDSLLRKAVQRLNMRAREQHRISGLVDNDTVFESESTQVKSIASKLFPGWGGSLRYLGHYIDTETERFSFQRKTFSSSDPTCAPVQSQVIDAWEKQFPDGRRGFLVYKWNSVASNIISAWLTAWQQASRDPRVVTAFSENRVIRTSEFEHLYKGECVPFESSSSSYTPGH